MKLIVLLLIVIPARADKLKTFFESISAVGTNQVLSGLQFAGNVQQQKLTDLSICGRFQYKTLAGARSRFMFIQSPTDWSLFKLGVGYKSSFVGFGNHDSHGSMPSFILQDVNSESYMIWSTNRWHHFCLSFRMSSSHLKVVKVWLIRFCNNP